MRMHYSHAPLVLSSGAVCYDYAMTPLARSTSPTLDAVAALDELRACLRSCKLAAPAGLRMALHDASDTIARVQSELSGAQPSIALSAVEALGTLRGRIAVVHDSDFALECGVAASLARGAYDRISKSERRISITSETYLRRLTQFLIELARS